MRRVRHRCLLATGLLLLATCGGEPGIPDTDLGIEVELSATQVRVGEGVGITVRRTWSDGLDPAPWDDAQLAPLELVPLGVTTVRADGRTLETRRFRAHPYAPGTVAMPAVVFPARRTSGGALRVVQAPVPPLVVVSGFATRPTPQAVLETPDPADPPVAMPRSAAAWWLAGLALLLLGAAFAGRRPVAPEAAPPPPEPPPGPTLAEQLDSPDLALEDVARLVRARLDAALGYPALQRTAEETTQAFDDPDLQFLLEAAARATYAGNPSGLPSGPEAASRARACLDRMGLGDGSILWCEDEA